MLPTLSFLVSLFGAASSSQDCINSQNSTFFGLETWYKYLNVTFDSTTGSCKITSFDPGSDGSQTVLGVHSPFLLVGLAIIDDLLRIAALVAIGFVIVGAFRFITSQGNPDDAAKARSTIIDALIGLVIAIVAVGVVSYIGSQLGSS